jgi:hypothetical protein
MSASKYWLQEQAIPDGYQIYEDCIGVAGEQYKRGDCQKFMKSKVLGVWLRRETDNAFDNNAILVIGKSKGLLRNREYKLGYIPREVAKHIVENGFWGKIIARLYNTYLGDTGFVDVKVQLLGPKGAKANWSGADTEWLFSDKYRIT